MWGVELVHGWVDHAEAKFQRAGLRFLQGDITDARAVLAAAGAGAERFDLIYLADVWEHVPPVSFLGTFAGATTLTRPHTSSIPSSGWCTCGRRLPRCSSPRAR